jgi:hypothetical protein
LAAQHRREHWIRRIDDFGQQRTGAAGTEARLIPVRDRGPEVRDSRRPRHARQAEHFAEDREGVGGVRLSAALDGIRADGCLTEEGRIRASGDQPVAARSPFPPRVLQSRRDRRPGLAERVIQRQRARRRPRGRRSVEELVELTERGRKYTSALPVVGCAARRRCPHGADPEAIVCRIDAEKAQGLTSLLEPGARAYVVNYKWSGTERSPVAAATAPSARAAASSRSE